MARPVIIVDLRNICRADKMTRANYVAVGQSTSESRPLSGLAALLVVCLLCVGAPLATGPDSNG